MNYTAIKVMKNHTARKQVKLCIFFCLRIFKIKFKKITVSHFRNSGLLK